MVFDSDKSNTECSLGFVDNIEDVVEAIMCAGGDGPCCPGGCRRENTSTGSSDSALDIVDSSSDVLTETSCCRL